MGPTTLARGKALLFPLANALGHPRVRGWIETEVAHRVGTTSRRSKLGGVNQLRGVVLVVLRRKGERRVEFPPASLKGSHHANLLGLLDVLLAIDRIVKERAGDG